MSPYRPDGSSPLSPSSSLLLSLPVPSLVSSDRDTPSKKSWTHGGRRRRGAADTLQLSLPVTLFTGFSSTSFGRSILLSSPAAVTHGVGGTRRTSRGGETERKRQSEGERGGRETSKCRSMQPQAEMMGRGRLVVTHRGGVCLRMCVRLSGHGGCPSSRHHQRGRGRGGIDGSVGGWRDGRGCDSAGTHGRSRRSLSFTAFRYDTHG